MKYEGLYRCFKERIPEGGPFYMKMEAENLVDETDGQYVPFGMVVAPFVEWVVVEKNHFLVRKVFDFLEEMARAEDRKIRDVLAYAVLEQLIDAEDDLLKQCMPFMGEETVNLCMATGNFYQR